ncbi:MAG: prephenate dehydrogenase/arogenate dehydrogenase family protein [Gallionellaceae bacterium]|nr:prephenate dehydrogenase/arogenate dehydrogenase family protein [Gallionellaceae bacterium]
MIERLAILGVGLIGGSVALALKRAGQVRHVVGYGRSRANLDEALALGVIDEIADRPESAVDGADRVLLAVPVGAMAATFAGIADHLAADVLITDAGSTKQNVIAAARAGLGARIARFVPAHPIAGAERSGASAARADLYDGRNVILTPLPENALDDTAAIAGLWQVCGAQVAEMAAAEHDSIFAAVSHLPHLAAFALVDELASRPQAGLFFRHAGSGFRDFTRIAGSSPEMWRDIALANRPALTAELDAYIARLSAYRDALAAGDAGTLMQSFTRASLARSRWQPGDTLEEDE